MLLGTSKTSEAHVLWLKTEILYKIHPKLKIVNFQKGNLSLNQIISHYFKIKIFSSYQKIKPNHGSQVKKGLYFIEKLYVTGHLGNIILNGMVIWFVPGQDI
ncbi:MAG: hypothetical protein CM15mP117_23770 [Alphaproteobacteria bacterium]|nr:MAG: hypothetical protein CM15mP117_23770 [Alphaproteobacteria bacterium]